MIEPGVMETMETMETMERVVDPQPDGTLADMVNRMVAEDPRLRLIAEMMRNQASAREQPRRPTVEDVLARYARLRQAYGWMRERNELVAAALGACPRCWGEEPDCTACDGLGTPGTYVLDQQLFDRYVLPAVRMLRARSRPASAAPPADLTPTPQEE
jgi:hypothetical protein